MKPLRDFEPYPTRREPVPFERCEVCDAILIDDEGCSWPYCPHGPHDPATVQLVEFARELAEDWP